MDTPTRERSDAPWLKTVDAVESELDSDRQRGLTSAEATRRLEIHGPNALDTTVRRGPMRVLARQFTNTMILILSAAGAVTYIVGDRTDTIVIAVIVVLNAVVGFFQEYRAERAMDELSDLTATTSSVVRDGILIELPATCLAPGDLVRMSAGDVVPADIRLTVAASLQVAEAALTGESEPVAKTTSAVRSDSGFVGERTNMAFKGTAVSDGRGEGIVVATGMATELGQIADLLAGDRSPTPLQRHLASLGHRLTAVAIGLCGVVFAAGVARGEAPDDMAITAISLAVAAIPEGLPAVLTVALALGARRMSRHRALVRRLPAVETLGAVDIICADKTGTLTQNTMAVERIWTPEGEYDVHGRGYDPSGTVTDRSGEFAPDVTGVAMVAAACNDAAILPPVDGEEWTATGDPTEAALVTMARRAGVHTSPERIDELPFDTERKRMSTVHRVDGGVWIATKGALDALVPLFRVGEPVARAIEAGDRLAEEGYRVLALAERHLDRMPDAEIIEQDLDLVGVVGISDPPRPGARRSVDTCTSAGITTVMITGDHPRTAAAIARRLGIVADGAEAVTTGPEVEALDDTELTERVADVRVFARTSPAQKLRIVDAWRRRGATVAMTGDGVNDAAALQQADIGVAMGLSGTDVSREAADMVLADDDFSTIVAAVGEGRRIYDNLRRFVLYLLATNSAEILVMLMGPFLGLPFPLTATQILYINLVTDGLPAVALGIEPAEPDIMTRRPRPRHQPILGSGLWQRAVAVGVMMATAVLVLQIVAEQQDMHWRTMGFATLAVLQLSHAVTVRSASRSLRSMLNVNPLLGVAVLGSILAQVAVLYVPALQTAFDTEPLRPTELAVVATVCVLAFIVGEADRARRARRSEHPSPTSE